MNRTCRTQSGKWKCRKRFRQTPFKSKFSWKSWT